MCKGKPPGAVVQTWQAGQTVSVQFEGSAKHGGVNESIYICFSIFIFLRESVNSPYLTITTNLSLSFRRLLVLVHKVNT